MGFAEQDIVLEELGAALYGGPYLASAVVAATALLSASDEAARSELLPPIASGQAVATLAVTEDDGSWDPAARTRSIRDILTLAPKGSSKTSYSAGIALTLMLMNKRPRAEGVFIGPTQSISDRAYEEGIARLERQLAYGGAAQVRTDHLCLLTIRGDK